MATRDPDFFRKKSRHLRFSTTDHSSIITFGRVSSRLTSANTSLVEGSCRQPKILPLTSSKSQLRPAKNSDSVIFQPFFVLDTITSAFLFFASEVQFFPKGSHLQGETGKMSASDPNSAIYVTDSGKDIKNKINKYAFSGGQDSVENHRKYGANLEVDIPIKYLGFFLEDDVELEHIRTEYGAGRMLTGEVKKRLTEILTEMVERHRRARAAVTDEMVDAFMAVRPLPNMFN